LKRQRNQRLQRSSGSGFTDEKLDFSINYDIKYRMGRESESLIE